MASTAEKQELQNYLDSHRVEPRLNELLNVLTAEMPPKPFAWMADQLPVSYTHLTLPTKA